MFHGHAKFNCCRNTDKSKNYLFWSAVDRVIEIYTGTGAHNRRHATSYEGTTNIISYAPNLLSIQELMEKEKELITEKYRKKEGVDFLVPYISWVYLELSPLYKNQKTVERYKWNLPLKNMILLCKDR